MKKLSKKRQKTNKEFHKRYKQKSTKKYKLKTPIKRYKLRNPTYFKWRNPQIRRIKKFTENTNKEIHTKICVEFEHQTESLIRSKRSHLTSHKRLENNITDIISASSTLLPELRWQQNDYNATQRFSIPKALIARQAFVQFSTFISKDWLQVYHKITLITFILLILILIHVILVTFIIFISILIC